MIGTRRLKNVVIFVQIILSFILYLYQLKNTLNILGALLEFFLWKSNRISEGNIENITNSNRNFAPIFLIIMYYQKINYKS